MEILSATYNEDIEEILVDVKDDNGNLGQITFWNLQEQEIKALLLNPNLAGKIAARKINTERTHVEPIYMEPDCSGSARQREFEDNW